MSVAPVSATSQERGPEGTQEITNENIVFAQAAFQLFRLRDRSFPVNHTDRELYVHDLIALLRETVNPDLNPDGELISSAIVNFASKKVEYLDTSDVQHPDEEYCQQTVAITCERLVRQFSDDRFPMSKPEVQLLVEGVVDISQNYLHPGLEVDTTSVADEIYYSRHPERRKVYGVGRLAVSGGKQSNGIPC